MPGNYFSTLDPIYESEEYHKVKFDPKKIKYTFNVKNNMYYVGINTVPIVDVHIVAEFAGFETELTIENVKTNIDVKKTKEFIKFKKKTYNYFRHRIATGVRKMMEDFGEQKLWDLISQNVIEDINKL